MLWDLKYTRRQAVLFITIVILADHEGPCNILLNSFFSFFLYFNLFLSKDPAQISAVQLLTSSCYVLWLLQHFFLSGKMFLVYIKLHHLLKEKTPPTCLNMKHFPWKQKQLSSAGQLQSFSMASSNAVWGNWSLKKNNYGGSSTSAHLNNSGFGEIFVLSNTKFSKTINLPYCLFWISSCDVFHDLHQQLTQPLWAGTSAG